MKHEGGPSLIFRWDFAIEIDRFPMLDASRFALAEVGTHGEGRNREFKRIFIVLSHALDEECADTVHRPLSVKSGADKVLK